MSYVVPDKRPVDWSRIWDGCPRDPDFEPQDNTPVDSREVGLLPWSQGGHSATAVFRELFFGVSSTHPAMVDIPDHPLVLREMGHPDTVQGSHPMEASFQASAADQQDQQNPQTHQGFPEASEPPVMSGAELDKWVQDFTNTLPLILNLLDGYSQQDVQSISSPRNTPVQRIFLQQMARVAQQDQPQQVGTQSKPPAFGFQYQRHQTDGVDTPDPTGAHMGLGQQPASTAPSAPGLDVPDQSQYQRAVPFPYGSAYPPRSAPQLQQAVLFTSGSPLGNQNAPQLQQALSSTTLPTS
ncbi:uncharacterized protein LTR77_000298 [Saxophila tyrrhenica]|uniref:Ameloblastin n=1 Tax=Saxophila tyrrhenica TaxID=1690608 RepID=A0AAV9PN69_9PEZI|nr:hypothetical protein LTR77_000298 [Saxophila tyrrhenica]